MELSIILRNQNKQTNKQTNENRYTAYCPEVGSDVTLDIDKDDRKISLYSYGAKSDVFVVSFDDINFVNESKNPAVAYAAFYKYHLNMYNTIYHKYPVSYFNITSCATYKYSPQYENYQLIHTSYDNNTLIIDYLNKNIRTVAPIGQGYTINHRAKVINVLGRDNSLFSNDFYETIEIHPTIEITFNDAKLGAGRLVVGTYFLKKGWGKILIYIGNYCYQLYVPDKEYENDFGLGYIRKNLDFRSDHFNISNQLR